jgi:hypothetical protein
MDKYLQTILEPASDTDFEEDEHVPAEDLARLAEGRISSGKRKEIFYHINRCRECYEMISGLFAFMKEEGLEEETKPEKVLERRKFFAIAASVLVIVVAMAGVYRVYQTKIVPERTFMASLEMTSQLKELLTADDSLEWTGERTKKLADMLSEKGFRVASLDKVVLKSPYTMTKDFTLLFGTKEIVNIRVEGDTAYLEVVRKKKE